MIVQDANAVAQLEVPQGDPVQETVGRGTGEERIGLCRRIQGGEGKEKSRRRGKERGEGREVKEDESRESSSRRRFPKESKEELYYNVGRRSLGLNSN